MFSRVTKVKNWLKMGQRLGWEVFSSLTFSTVFWDTVRILKFSIKVHNV